MITVGVTGGIGSGKTTICREWEKLGAYVFYADEEAKGIMVKNKNVIAQIKQTFGELSYNEDGTLNKPFLIREAFHSGRVEELNDIVHPAVGLAFRKACKRAEKDGYEMAVKEAALLLNKGRPRDLDKVVIVDGDKNIRLKRVMERDQSTTGEIKQRMKHQPDFEKKKHLADFLIINNGTLSDLKKEAAAVYHKIIEEYHSGKSDNDDNGM